MIKVASHNYSFFNFVELDIDTLKLVLSWRNDVSVRKWMYTQDEISLYDHLKFVESLRSKEDKIYYAVRRNNVFIGVFSLIDFNGKSGEWGYYLAPEFHHHGLGVEFYYATLKFCFDILRLENLVGYALINNRSANSLNNLFGFKGEKFQKPESTELFYKLELSSKIWNEEISENKKIKKLLAITTKKE